MNVGEKMSTVIEMEKIVWDATGDAYEDEIAVLRNRPLDVGRLVYAKLRMAFPEDVKIEVWWNHFDETIHCEIENTAGRTFGSNFPVEQMARTDLVQRLDAWVEMVRSISDVR